MIRTIYFVVDCKNETEFLDLYLDIDEKYVEQIKAMSWKEGDIIKQSEEVEQ